VGNWNILVLHQKRQQFKLLGRQMDYPAGLAQRATFQLQFQLTEAENQCRRLFTAPAAAKNRA
jgi:hypothetical protein